MRRIYCTCIFLCSLLLVTTMAGCVQSGPSGKWARNSNDARIFEEKTVLEDHTYYFRGNEVAPDSIIAVDNSYTLQTKVWTRVDITQKILDDWMFWIHSRPNISCPYYGGAILTPDGKKAGIWYSKKLVTTVKTLESGELQVYPPYSLPGSSCARQERLDDL